MYPVSNEYLTAMNENVQSGYISGTIDGVDFSPNDVLLGSASVSNKCVDPSNICLGGVNIGVLKITFTNDTLVTRGTWEGKEIVVNWSQLIDDENQTFETVPVGVYIISEANHAAEGVVVTAYDRMSLLDKDLTFTTSSGAVYSLLSLIADECGVTLGMTRPQIEALPNGEEVFSIYPDNDMKTFRNLLGYVAACCGSFATFNRSGELILKQFSGLPILNISADKRMKGGSFSDFKTFYTSVSVLDIATQTESVEKLPLNNGLMMDLGANPLLQYGLIDTKRRQRQAILESLLDFKYTPFTTTLLGNPIFDLGDVFNFTNGIAGTTSKGCLMEYTYIFNRSYNMTGYGKNPALLGVISKADRQSTMNARTNVSNEVKFIHYTNAEDVYIYADNAEAFTTLATIEVITDREGWAEVETTLIFQVSSNVALIENAIRGRLLYEHLRFELDGEFVSRFLNTEFSFSARNTAYDFAIEHYFAFRAGANERKVLTLKIANDFLYVYTSASGNTREDDNANSFIHIWEKDLNIYVKGQCLTKEAHWDGLVVLDDNLPRYEYGLLTPDEIEDNVVASILDVESVGLTDDISESEYATIEPVEVAESYTITFVKPKRNIISIHGDNLVNIDETENITTI